MSVFSQGHRAHTFIYAHSVSFKHMWIYTFSHVVFVFQSNFHMRDIFDIFGPKKFFIQYLSVSLYCAEDIHSMFL